MLWTMVVPARNGDARQGRAIEQVFLDDRRNVVVEVRQMDAEKRMASSAQTSLMGVDAVDI